MDTLLGKTTLTVFIFSSLKYESVIKGKNFSPMNSFPPFVQESNKEVAKVISI